MLIPLRPENMASRRGPVVTFALIVATSSVPLSPMHIKHKARARRTPVHIILLRRMHPEF